MARWLVFGGTRFLSRAIVAAALGAGHEVVCAARGVSGPVPAGARLVPVDRDTGAGLDALRGERFDEVVDVARMSLPWVRDALRTVDAGRWTFVSTISVYADNETVGQTTDAPLVAAVHEPDPAPEAYGGVKVAAEEAVREAVGERAFVVRAGLLCGPGDESDRFGYWPARFARGGRAVVPDAPRQPVQVVDVRDVAEWVVGSAAEHRTGTFDAVGPSRPMGAVLAEIAAATGAPDLELVPVDPAVLDAAGVTPWMGPRSLPLWLPPEHDGHSTRDGAPAAAAGLRSRPLADTAVAALAHERVLGLDRPRKAGLSPRDEQAVLAGR